MDFLEPRGVLVSIKRAAASGAAAGSAMVALLLCSPAGPQHLVPRLLAGTVAAGALAAAFWWLLRPWPTPRQSAWFIALGDNGITLVCWLDDTTDPRVTASVGVAVTTAHDLPHDRDIDRVLACADGAMYKAKRRGGNGVVVDTCTAYAEGIRLHGGCQNMELPNAVGRSCSNNSSAN